MIEEIKIRLQKMKRTPNTNAAYALAVSDMEWLLKELEQNAKDITDLKNIQADNIGNEYIKKKQRTDKTLL